jgi:hypothetical protein
LPKSGFKEHAMAERHLAGFLRLVGVVEMLAFGAMLMPRAWMQGVHAWLGLGELPAGAVFDTVMREVSFFYAMHGVSLWIIAADVGRYRPLVLVTGIGYGGAGIVHLAIDLANSMPLAWTAAGSATCFAIGIAVLYLARGDVARANVVAPS